MNKRGCFECSFVSQGCLVAGVDEVGRGCLAGPVFAAAVVLDFKKLAMLNPKKKGLVRDSKTLSEKQRLEILPLIRKISLGFGLGEVGVREIEAIGIANAVEKAMFAAVNRLKVQFGILLVDGKRALSAYKGEQYCIIRGDQSCYSIAAASIVAKQSRDLWMKAQEKKFPGYGFSTNVGYGTSEHIKAIAAKGSCSLHRRNFSPVSKLCHK